MDEELIPPELRLSPELFESLFCAKDFPDLPMMALEGHLASTHNRFISWRIFLGFFPESGPVSVWISHVEELRARYRQLKDSLTKINLTDLDPLIHNPLSSSSENPWNDFHKDNQLKTLIKLDVDRTFQDKSLFLLKEVHDLMTNILFIWAKSNPELSYKQGMNELLGILIFVGFCELPEDAINISYENQQALRILNSKEGLEADIYWCFSRIMDLGIRDLFNPVVSHKPRPRKTDLFTWETEKFHNDLVNTDKSNELNVSHILRRSHKIHHNLLKLSDPEIYNYLEKQKIEPQMYLQRWLRCMLTREFNLMDSLIIWDAIFASYYLDPEMELELLDYLCVAMIRFVRSFLLQCDHFGVLRRLLRFPPVEDVHDIVSMALRIKEGGEVGVGSTEKEETEEDIEKSVVGSLEAAIMLLKKLIEEKAYDEYKYQKAVDYTYRIKCQVIKEFPIDYQEIN